MEPYTTSTVHLYADLKTLSSICDYCHTITSFTLQNTDLQFLLCTAVR